MSHPTLLSSIAIFTLVASAAVSQTLPPGAPPAAPQPPATVTPAAPTTATATPQPAVETPPAELDGYLQSAVAAFGRGELAKSGGICFQAAAYAESLGDPTEANFSEAIARLRILGYDVASHDIKAPERFDQSAAAIHIALADEALRAAKGAWDERRARATGESLGYASDHLARAIRWGGHNTSEQGDATIALAARNARELTNESVPAPPPGLVTASLRDMGVMISAVAETFATARETIGVDERVGDAAERAVEGIQTGTRKAAEAVGGTFRRWGRWLEGKASE